MARHSLAPEAAAKELRAILSQQLGPISALRLTQIIPPNGSLSGLSATGLDKLAEQLARNPQYGIRLTKRGNLALYGPAEPDAELHTEHQFRYALENIEHGKPGWSKFENWCRQAARRLFEPDLEFQTVRESANRADRMDMVAVIQSREVFWRDLATDKNTRYIVFEFKNNSARLPPDDVQKTSIYLIRDRQVAVMICRSEPGAPALQETQRQLRDGKLILMLTAERILEMLRLKDHGNDFLAIFKDDLHNFRISLDR